MIYTYIEGRGRGILITPAFIYDVYTYCREEGGAGGGIIIKISFIYNILYKYRPLVERD